MFTQLPLKILFVFLIDLSEVSVLCVYFNNPDLFPKDLNIGPIDLRSGNIGSPFITSLNWFHSSEARFHLHIAKSAVLFLMLPKFITRDLIADLEFDSAMFLLFVNMTGATIGPVSSRVGFTASRSIHTTN